MMKNVVSANWLKDNIEDSHLVILDTSIHLNTKVNNLTIKGARFFDLKNTFVNQNSELPNTIPTLESFEFEAQKLGLNKNSKIVVFDSSGVYSSPRAWWLFKLMGYNQVFVLDGGLPEWIKNGFDTEERNENFQYPYGNFKINYQPKLCRSFNEIKKNIELKKEILIDARSHNRFYGLTPEPRINLRGGHIPSSINIPFESVLSHNKFKSENELKIIFNQFDLKGKSLIFSCGSGITACIVYLACETVLNNDKAIYDGSWSEWAQLTNE